MCFDTTSSNTGHRAGACILLEQKLERDLLYLACWHHIMELIQSCDGGWPAVPLFKRFQTGWDSINHESGKVMVQSSHDELLEFLSSHNQEMITENSLNFPWSFLDKLHLVGFTSRHQDQCSTLAGWVQSSTVSRFWCFVDNLNSQQKRKAIWK